MNVLGIDVGYSETKKTNAYCLLEVDKQSKMIDIIINPVKYCIRDAKFEFTRVFGEYKNISLIAMDAPLTPKLISKIPNVGRKIEKVFSKGEFNNYHRGPQPSSIRVPMPGWKLYNAGMDTIAMIKSINSKIAYLSFEDLNIGKQDGIIEVIPKLTQALLVSNRIVTGRGKAKIDDFIFPQLFSLNGQERMNLDRALAGYCLTKRLQTKIEIFAEKPKRYHEELASIVSAIQGVMLITGRAVTFGFKGDYEGYYILPKIEYWHEDWNKNFETTI